MCLLCATHLPGYAPCDDDDNNFSAFVGEEAAVAGQLSELSAAGAASPPPPTTTTSSSDGDGFGAGGRRRRRRHRPRHKTLQTTQTTAPPQPPPRSSSPSQMRSYVREGMNLLEIVSENYNFAPLLEERAKREYVRLSSRLSSGKQASSLAALCLYNACRSENVGRDCKTICAMFDIETKDFWNLEKKFQPPLPPPPPARPPPLTPRVDNVIDAIWFSQQKLLKPFGINRDNFERLAGLAEDLQQSFCRQKSTLFAACLLLWGRRHNRSELTSRRCSHIARVSTSAVCRLVNELRAHGELHLALGEIKPTTMTAAAAAAVATGPPGRAEDQ